MLPELVFYDGDCGLCHRGVRFVLWADRSGAAFRFAPLGGDTFRREVPAAAAAQLPDSWVVRREDGTLLVRSAAVVHVLQRLGGVWQLLGTLLACVPRGLRDRAYDAVARLRHRLFRRPPSRCPAPAPGLRARFDP